MAMLKVTVGDFIIELDGKEIELLDRFDGVLKNLSSKNFEKVLYVVGEKRQKPEQAKIVAETKIRKTVTRTPKLQKKQPKKRTGKQFDENGNEVCQICGKAMSSGSKGMPFHVKSHGMSYKEYREKYPIKQVD
jgi:hypothetical protein